MNVRTAIVQEHCRRSIRRREAQGFTLLEVIVALAILVMAVAVLGELARFSLKNAKAAKELSRAQMLAESKMSELIAGVVPLEATSDAAFDDLPAATAGDWRYSIEVDDTETTGLMAVSLVVKPAENASNSNTFTLSRWVVDPADKLAAATAAAAAKSSSTASSSTSSTTGSTTGGATGGTSTGTSGK